MSRSRAGSGASICGDTAYLIEHMFVLGIDPGLSVTGYGVIEAVGPGCGPSPPV